MSEPQFFMAARAMGYLLLFAMLLLSLLTAPRHRLIFAAFLSWVFVVIAVTLLRQQGNAAAADWVINWIGTPLLFAPSLAMVKKILEYMKKRAEGHMPPQDPV